MKRLTAYALLAILVGTAAFATTSSVVGAHGTHAVKSLLPSRYDLPPPPTTNPQQPWIDWMTLSTDFDFLCCASTFDSPARDAVTDWTGSQTTVALPTRSYHSAGNQLHVVVGNYPNSPDLGWIQPWVREDLPPYLGYNPCNGFDPNCVFDKCNAIANNSRLIGGWATYGGRRHVVAHEIGHCVGLGEETSSCPSGPNPQSVMHSDCAQYVRPWDWCGVNHKYHDPWWGYPGC